MLLLPLTWSLKAAPRARLEIGAGFSLVKIEAAKETLMFATAGLDAHFEESRWVGGFNYLRSLMIGASVGSLAFTNVKVGYNLLDGKWRSDNLFGLGIDYQIGGFNFGQIPMLGLMIFGSGTLPYPGYWWQINVAGFYASLDSVYESKDTFRAEVTIGQSLSPNLLAFLGLDYRDFSYRTVATSSGFSQLSLSSLALGLGLSY